MNDSDNVIALTDEAQAVRRAQPDADRARWKGALWMGPELDLYYMRNRWYEPATGRFLSEDPIGLAGGINPVVFAGGDPIRGRDPRGLCEENEELWVRWVERPNAFGGTDEIILGYFCVPTGGGGTGGGGGKGKSDGEKTRRVGLTECPVPPPFPDGVDLNANIQIALGWRAWPNKVGVFKSLVEGEGPWDIKRRDPNPERFQAAGNFHYGATGTAFGFSRWELRVASSAAHLHDNEGASYLSGVARTFLRGSYDPADDQANIDAGIQYTKNGCTTR